MKKAISAILVLLMVISMLPAANAEAYQIEEGSYAIYLASSENMADEPYSLYFMNGVDDLPYVNLLEWANMLYEINVYLFGNETYDLDYVENGPVVTITRENGYPMTLDFDNDKIIFTDYNSFLRDTEDSTLIDVLSASGFNEDGDVSLFRRSLKESFDRYGDSTSIDLAPYGIDLIYQDGNYYVPLQTLNDLILFPSLHFGLLFNGEAIFFANERSFYHEEEAAYTPLAELYYSAPTDELSEELAEFNYNELCLALDCLYGLKGPHDIKNFRQTFWEIAFDEVLSSTNPTNVDLALHQFINFYLDDQHSAFLEPSYRAGLESQFENPVSVGQASGRMNGHMESYAAARAVVYPDGVPGYEEVGNTAYVTFDGFTFDYDPEDYYAFGKENEPLQDTIGLIIYAHSQITRPDSPIENVVLDLSNNTGGAADAAVFVISWILGDASLSLKDTFTGAMTSTVYRADVNLDRRFDEADSLADKDVYCLISPVSFSCGNLVPAALKMSQKVTLLGTTSGGGSCVVQPMSTASGALFQISGTSRLSFLKNGSFYDIDQGIDPDFFINDISHYYDRKLLTDYINGLF